MRRCINEGSDELFFDFGGSRAISKDFRRWPWQNDIGRRLPRYGFLRAKYLSKEQSSSSSDEYYVFYFRLPKPEVPLKIYSKPASMHMDSMDSCAYPQRHAQTVAAPKQYYTLFVCAPHQLSKIMYDQPAECKENNYASPKDPFVLFRSPLDHPNCITTYT